MTNRDSISIALTGSGGAGVMTAAGLLLDVAAKAGCYGLQTRSVGPQIRGGESAALLRLANRPIGCHGKGFDVLFALDWNNFSRFAAEIRLGRDSVVIADPAAGAVPDEIMSATGNIVDIPVKEIVKSVSGGRANMVALGVLAGALGLPEANVRDTAANKLSAKGDQAVEAGTACIRAGYQCTADLKAFPRLAADEPESSGTADRWLITGNEAAGLGALRGGIRFAAAYPITPATEVLEWLAPALAKAGGTLVQAEDELASINMIIGASYGGIPALTATSGPGLALMTESIGLATAAEVPIVVVDVMRCGPSTGIPTKSEQSDLNIAVYGLHGDAPHLVVAPLSVADCLLTTQWAVHLAEAMQVPAIVLSDQFLGQARMIIDRPADVAFIANRSCARRCDTEYSRYAIAANGVSPMAIPGTPGGQYTADGLEHTPAGIPSSGAEDHLAQLNKRRIKVEEFSYGDHWGEIDGDGDCVIVTWGSVSAAVREAAARVRAEGVSVKTVAVRLLSPLPVEALTGALEGARRVLVVEQNDGAQFYRHLRGCMDLPSNTRAVHQPGPLAISPDDIYREIMTEHET